MKTLRWVAAIVLLATAAPSSLGYAKEGDWVKPGERRVMLVQDHDTVVVNAMREDFRKMRLRVEEIGVFFHHLSVQYSNGALDTIPIGMRIPACRYSRVIDLRGRDRFIRRVGIFYRAVRNSRGHATVAVLGRR